MYFQSMLNAKIYLQYGTSLATTLYDLSENLLNRSLVQALPCLHAFSGCDTANCFEGKGTLEKHKFSQRGGFRRATRNFSGQGRFHEIEHFDKTFYQKVKKKDPVWKNFRAFSLRYS